MKRLFIVVCLYCFLISPCVAQSQLANALTGSIRKFQGSSKTNPPKIAISVVDLESRQQLFGYNENDPVSPASVLKIATTFAVLKTLGPEYQFPTEAYTDKKPADIAEGKQGASSVGNLYIRGYGDPTVVSETMSNWAETIKAMGVSKIDNVVIDDSLFVEPRVASGTDPYEAAQSATSLNHNSYLIRVTPLGASMPALVSSTQGAGVRIKSDVVTTSSGSTQIATSQTPPSANFVRKTVAGPFPGFELLGTQLPDVIVRGSIKEEAIPYVDYKSIPDPVANYGLTLKYYLELFGVKVSGAVYRGEIPSRAKLLTEFDSKPLADIVNNLNHYSNNFIAGQLVYALGQDPVGYFHFDRGIKRIESVLAGIGIQSGSYTLVDGSGLNEKNRISAQQLARILLAAYSDFSVAPTFISSLSRYGHSGTLKKRNLNLQGAGAGLEDSVWAKTGTIDNVSSLAGYGVSQQGRRFAFVIITNGQASKQAAMQFEDDIVERIIKNKS